MGGPAGGRYRAPRAPAMKLTVTPTFLEEERRFRLVHHCQDCALHDPERLPPNRCAHGYPTEEHERTEGRDTLVFCKEFEPI